MNFFTIVLISSQQKTGSLTNTADYFVKGDRCEGCDTSFRIPTPIQEITHKLSQHNHISLAEICPRVSRQLEQF